MRKEFYLLFILFFYITTVKTQAKKGSLNSDSLTVKYLEPLHTIDSLKNKTYKDLIRIIYGEEENISTKEICSNIFYKKARKEKNPKRISDAYRNLSYIGSLKDSPLEIQYLDSIIDYTRDLNLKEYPSFAYYIKGLVLYDKRDFKNSLDNFIAAHKFAKKNKDLNLLNDIKHSIAILKSRIGNYKEALEIFKECRSYIEIQSDENQNIESYLAILLSLSDLYRRNNYIDSSTTTNKIGIDKSIINKSKIYQGYFTLSEGINHYIRNDYTKSVDNIERSLEIIEKMNDKSNVAYVNFYLGKNYERLNQIEKSIKYFKKVDTIFQQTRDIHPDLRKSYEFLINYYKDNNDKGSQLTYIERLISLDSILLDNYKYISVNLNQKFDTPELLFRKEKLIESISHERKILLYVLILSSLIIIIIVVLFHFNNRKKLIYKGKFEEILANPPKVSIKSSNVPNEKELNLSEKISNHILLGLKNFENKKGYLSKDLTITSLAKELNTNTKYLSKFINFYEEKTFSNYVNNLRIVHIIEKLKDDKKFRLYTIKAISDSAGFRNPESFSQSFFKHTGIYPSYFIKKLNEKRKNIK